MEFRDPLHGGITLLPEEVSVISDDFFNRLRHVKQMGLSEHLFPGATHSRFLHSLGVMHLAHTIFIKLFGNSSKFNCIRETFRLAALLHDIGHPPLSHTTESMMPSGLCHEDYSVRIITEGALNLKLISKKYGTLPQKVASLITGINNDNYFEINGHDYFPILHQLISGELDCDRMDYLLRDSFFCGVAYGNFDLPWIIENLKPVVINKKVYLGIDQKALITFDDFLISRLHMFLMVYFHYKSVCLEMLLLQYLKESGEYVIPYNLDEYKLHDDNYLLTVMKNSSHSLAKNILKHNIPDKIFESTSPSEEKTLSVIEHILKKEKITYFKCSSSSRLSKYEKETIFPLKVLKTNEITDITKVSKSFKKFAGNYKINRLYVYLNKFRLPKEIAKIINIDT